MTDSPILALDHPLLAAPSEPVEAFDGRLADLSDEMFEILDAVQGAALTAVQIGEPVRLVTIDMPDASGERHRLTLVNPRISAQSDTMRTGREGSLSLPGTIIDVPRYTRVEVTYQTLDGVKSTLTADGPLATGLQHAVDHTDGILFHQRAELRHLASGFDPIAFARRTIHH